ncbi:hypothetical protein AT15_09005 [Kosmotoga arenicorallina S304]|uniref:Uncharacterized protein n=1 Tax=Kosmotoga arenicorallina S304 TaxID=1453497 RepID=A0A176K2A4_9BACT|nr:hypothetical protein [Kosmotoga arenicorallina]OAA31104.1 hypothetical protein AT15_09005 [Kosmotoga arenicorallina S304]
MRKVLLSTLIIIVAVLAFGKLSLGANSLVVASYVIDPSATPFVGIAESIDARVTLGMFHGGLMTPFMLFAFSADAGSNLVAFPPGLIWYAYAGGHLPFGRMYALADLGVLISFGGVAPNFVVLRVGGGMKLGMHGFVEFTTLAALQDIGNTIGRLFTLEFGYTF